MRVVAATATLALAAAFAVPAFAQGPSMPDGHAVFEKWCAPCHDPGPFHAGTAGLTVKYKGSKPAALEQRTDLTPEIVKYFVRHGMNAMPPFRKTEIDDAQLNAVANYLSHGKEAGGLGK